MNNNSPIVSIIVPVYKAEAYLARCINSILKQTFTHFELLLIDDGSPDKSGDICDTFAKQDSRVRVFHNENGGVSSARQCGLDNVRGDYVIHVDPDDWVESSMLEELYEKAVHDNSDMVICDYYWDNGGVSKIIEQKPSSLDNETVLSDMFGHLHGSLWNKLVRVESYKRDNINFAKNINLYEDLIFNIKLLKNPIQISYLNKPFYHYIQNENPNSLTRAYNEQVLERDRNITKYISTLMEGTPCYFKCRVYLNAMILQRAFFSGYFTNADFFRQFYHLRKSLLKARHMNIVIRIAIYLSCIGLYKPIYKVMNFLRSNTSKKSDADV